MVSIDMWWQLDMGGNKCGSVHVLVYEFQDEQRQKMKLVTLYFVSILLLT